MFNNVHNLIFIHKITSYLILLKTDFRYRKGHCDHRNLDTEKDLIILKGFEIVL